VLVEAAQLLNSSWCPLHLIILEWPKNLQFIRCHVKLN